jgi:hypothetical protein
MTHHDALGVSKHSEKHNTELQYLDCEVSKTHAAEFMALKNNTATIRHH